MPADDKIEYKKLLKILDMTGSGPAVMNKLGDLIIDMQDPSLKRVSQAVANHFHADPQTNHAKKVRLLDFAARWATTPNSSQNTAKNILQIKAYCDAQIIKQVPQWQIIARAEGWGPLSPPNA